VERPTLIENRAARRQARVALVMVVAPLLGLVAAIVLAWGRGVGLVDVALLASFYVLGVVGVEVGLHRYFAHRAFEAAGPVRVALAVLGSMAAQGPIHFWVAVHRRHHAHSDRAGDPHSPHGEDLGPRELLKGLWHAHVGWLFAGDVTDPGRYAPDILRDRLILGISRLYVLWLLLGLALPALIGGCATRSWWGALSGFLWGGLVRTFLVHHATWSVNSLCHMFGSRPFPTRDRSTNIPWLALPSLGGSWHNNHHAFPTAASTSVAWWQLDPCGWLIGWLERLGWVWNVRRPRQVSP
jgi:stearoyl-CoA desaturase (delta-9 desaturase)